MKRFILGAGESGDLSCSLEVLVDTRLLVQANSGGGKSWCLRRLLEQTHGQVQQLVIDPEGEFASLREKFDYVLAAKHGGDTAADPRGAKLLAERLLELGVSAVLDIYELKAHDRIRFVRSFLEALVDAPKKLWHPALVVVDEAHVYCPQKGEAESAGAVIDLATRGRKRGFCCILATQRLSKLHKDAAAECNNKLIGRTGLDVDIARAADELGLRTKDDQQKLRDLRPGEFFGFGPALSRGVQMVRVGAVSTSHPKAGARIASVAPPPTASVKALLPKLSDLPAEAEARQKNVDELKKEIASLKRELSARPQVKVPETKIERVEVPVITEDQITDLGHYQEMLDRNVESIASALAGVRSTVESIKTAIHVARQPVRATICPPPRTVPEARRPLEQLARAAADSNGHLSRPQQKILDSLAWLESVGVARADRVRVAMLADQSPRSSGYEKNVSTLRTAGMISYPDPGSVMLTAEGRARASAPDRPATVEDLRDAIRRKVSGPQWSILSFVISGYPEAFSREQVADGAGASAASSGFEKNISTLRSLGFIDYPSPGFVAAQPILFLEESA